MDNPDKLATLGTQNTRRRQTIQETQHNMCWRPLCAHKHFNLLIFAVFTKLRFLLRVLTAALQTLDEGPGHG